MTFPPAGPPPPPPAFTRPFGLVLLGILNALGALICLGLGAVLLLVSMADADQAGESRLVLVVVGSLLTLAGAFHATTAIGLFLLKGFGRICQMIQSAVGLLAIPLGTIVSALILYYLTRPGMALLFSGRPPAAMTADERGLVSRDSDQGVAIVAVAIVALFGGVALIGIVAAIAIPALLKARMAGNEASAIGSLRAMSSAQAAYSATHDGRYGTLECLTAPSSCPGGDGASSNEPFLGRDTANLGPRSGYAFRLFLSPDHDHFVYWAEPAVAGQTGMRAFCVAETSTVLDYLDYRTRGPYPPSDAEQGCPNGGRSL